MQIASFYTKNTPYEQIAKDYLLTSCKKWKLEITMVEVENKHSWIRNVAEKPKIIRELLDKYDKLVFLDADATIERDPVLFDVIPDRYDIALHMLNWNDFYGYKQTGPTLELLSGTLFFRNRPKVKTLCEEWYNQAINSNMWEQKILQNIIHKSGVSIYHLPVEYCAIVRSPAFANVGKKILYPVILHHQKSREMKHKII